MAAMGKHPNELIELDLLRYQILNTIRFNNVKYKQEFGQLVIATDSQNSWRRSAFPFYKASRKKTRDQSDIDWVTFYRHINQIRDEIRTHLSYPVIHVNTAEADDIIGVLSRYVRQMNNEPVLILSGDKDYIQLQTDREVKQFDPVKKLEIFHADPKFYMFRHIVKGDRGDGVPNIKSDDNVFMLEGVRQKPVRETEIEEWYAAGGVPDEYRDKYARNELLIGLSSTPIDLVKESVLQYKTQQGKPHNIVKYFMDTKQRQLHASIQDFY